MHVCVCVCTCTCVCAFVCKSHELITVEIMMTPSEVSDRTPAEGIHIIRVSLLGEVLGGLNRCQQLKVGRV